MEASDGACNETTEYCLSHSIGVLDLLGPAAVYILQLQEHL